MKYLKELIYSSHLITHSRLLLIFYILLLVADCKLNSDLYSSPSNHMMLPSLHNSITEVSLCELLRELLRELLFE